MPRPEVGKVQSHWRVLPETRVTLNELAKALGYTYNNNGAVGELLDAIASGEVLLVRTEKNKK